MVAVPVGDPRVGRCGRLCRRRDAGLRARDPACLRLAGLPVVAAAPARRLYYNIVTTWATVFVAGFICSVYLAAVLVEHAGVAFLSGYAGLADHFELLGYVIVAFFVAVWTGAVALWRFGGCDPRYGSPGSVGDLEETGPGRAPP